MVFGSAANDFVFTAGCILFAVHFSKVARDLLSPGKRRGAFQMCGRLARLLHSRFWRRDPKDEFAEEIAGRLLEWQLSQFKGTLKVMLHLLTMPVMAMAFYNVVLGRHRFQTPEQDALFVTWYTALLLVDWCPWLVTKRNLDLWYSGLMAILALSIIPPWCSSNHQFEAVFIAKMLGGLLSIGRMNLSAVILWSGVHMACEYWTHSVQGKSMAMNFWLLWPFLVSVLIGKIEAHLEGEFRKDLEAKVIQDRQSAGDALSAMFYDVTVELDHDLCIVGPTAKLKAFLLRNTPVPLEHTPLEDLLQDEEDRDRLRNLLCPANGPAASSFVELAHARMRGGLGTVFQVELFGYRYRGLGGRQRYLVGIREAGDFDAGGVPRVHDAGPQPVDVAPLDEVVVVINPYGAQFPILSHTPGFNIRIMPVLEGSCLLPALTKRDKFEAWVQKTMNWQIAALSDDEEELPGEPPAASLTVTFKPRGRNSPMRTAAVCQLEVKEVDPSEDESYDISYTAKLNFSEILQIPRDLGDGSRSSCSSSSSGSGRGGTPSSCVRVALDGGRSPVFGAHASL